MLIGLPAPLLGALMLLLLAVNTVIFALPVYVGILLKLLLPIKPLRDRLSRLIAWFAQTWAVVNTLLTDTLLDIRWDIRGFGEGGVQTRLDGQYLVCANHQTWNDISVLMKVFGHRAPFFKFFLKQELIWVPVLGLAWWGLDYPFMKRHTRAALAKNPALRGEDLETTRRACEKFRSQPVMILNFLEGTRFTPAKHKHQSSPYQHLLKPKSGGFAFALAALGEQINALIDVTIVYPEGARGFWDYLCGRVRHVVVEVRQLKIPHELYVGDYQNDALARARFHAWIAQLWREKDARIEALLSETALSRGKTAG